MGDESERQREITLNYAKSPKINSSVQRVEKSPSDERNDKDADHATPQDL